MAGLTLDTGALIAYERADRRALLHLKEALLRGAELTLPTAVLVEAWRGGTPSARIAKLAEACEVEPLSEKLAKIAGEALARVQGPSVVDAIVMSSAAQRGDRVLTSDFDDLDRLRACFPAVRLLSL